MAHKIQNNMIAFKGETPWHGLGVAVTPEMTGAEMLVAAKMAWRVQRRRLAMRDASTAPKRSATLTTQGC